MLWVVFKAGGQEEVRAHVESEFWTHPDGSCGRSRTNRAGAETGGSASHALGPLILEGLSAAQRTWIWTSDRVGTTAKGYKLVNIIWSINPFTSVSPSHFIHVICEAKKGTQNLSMYRAEHTQTAHVCLRYVNMVNILERAVLHSF